MDDTKSPWVIFPCPKCRLLCGGARDLDGDKLSCEHCGAKIRIPECSSIPPQYEVENVDFDYNLSDLVTRLTKGWKSIRELAGLLGISVLHAISKFANPTRPLEKRVSDGICEALCCGDETNLEVFLALRDAVLNSAAHLSIGTPSSKAHDHLTPTQRLEAYRHLAEALSQSKTVEEALTRLLPASVARKAPQVLLLEHLAPVPCRISETERAQFALIAGGAQSHDACDEAWWGCVEIETSRMCRQLLAIQRKIEGGEPLTNDEHISLNKYLREGNPVALWVSGEDTCGHYIVSIGPDFEMINRMGVQQMATAFLIQPAYHLARELEDWCKRVGNRFVLTCRNPACGRAFYSGHHDAVACPKKPHERVTSPCKREWDKYSRWLRSQGHDPDAAWTQKDLKEQYLARPPSRDL